MTRRISPEGRLHDYHPDVGKIWRSRDDEPEQEMFERQPTWMQTEPTDRDDLIDLQRVVPQILETITSREQKLLWCRLWADYTLDEIGMVFGVTKERIRQIEAKALRKLKHPSRSDLLLPFANICPVKIRKENERVKEYQRWWKEQHEKEMLERHIKYMENQLIETLLELRETT